VGLTGLIGAGGRVVRRVRVPGSLVTAGFRWSGIDRRTQRWWPQGIAVGDHDGVPVAIVSWFSKSRAQRRQLWGVTEHPGQRWVYALDWAG
jgi:hypothetical protein